MDLKNSVLKILFLAIIFTSCKNKQATIKKVEYTKEVSSEKHSKSEAIFENFDLIWDKQEQKLLSQKTQSDFGNEKLIFINQKKDTLLSFNAQEGSQLSIPFVMNFDQELFLVFFEVYSGTGFLSEKQCYHFNPYKSHVQKINTPNRKSIFDTAYKQFKITDSLYTRKGEFYTHFSFEEDIVDSKNEIPFQWILHNATKPHLNKGLEGFKSLKGVYFLRKEKDRYELDFKNLELIDI